jgi:putative nucleotidyltransferase with HDIG domain
VNTVLIVDDEPAVRDVIARWAASFGLETRSASSAEDALIKLRTRPCDLAIVDVMMPGRDGFWLAEQMHRSHPETAVVLATARPDVTDGECAQHGVADLLVKPFQRDRLQLAVERGRFWQRDARADQQWLRQLNTELRDGLEAIARDMSGRLLHGHDEQTALRQLAAARVPRTLAHSERVVRYAGSITREMGVGDADAALITIAALFHDIGKAAMPLALLTKPSSLSDRERTIMRRHVDLGADLLESLPTLSAASPLVRASHEWFGGGGYPHGLKGDEIPLGSRIITVADAYDAITQHRAYRNQVGSAEAVKELLRCCPTQFDPAVVDAFLRVLSCH